MKNYSDIYSVTAVTSHRVTPDDLFSSVFEYRPLPVRALFAVRDRIAAVAGLKRGGGFADCICERDDSHLTVVKNDRHLSLTVVLRCAALDGGRQTLSVETRVEFHNSAGKAYFFFIKPIHKILCRTALRRAAGLARSPWR